MFISCDKSHRGGSVLNFLLFGYIKQQTFSLYVWGFYTVYQQLFNGNSSQVCVSWTIFNKSIILTLVGQSKCYFHNSERQGGKPLVPVFKNLVCCGRGLNPRPQTQEAESGNYKLLDLSKLKEFADNKLIWNSCDLYFHWMDENIV